MVKTIPKENESPDKGFPIIFDLEIDGVVYKQQIICPGCQQKLYWLRSDNAGLYCAACGVPISKTLSDIADLKGVGWNIPGIKKL